MIAGRVEARVTVPTGGAAMSVANGALSSAVTVTLPAANYFHTAAGGVSSLLTVLQTQLNDNVQGYPTTAAAMQAALGYGNWTSGAAWLLNEASGNLAPAFGAPTLTATSLTYGAPGPAGATASSIDKAIGFDAGTDNADGGDNFDVTGTDDIIVAWVAKFSSTPTAIKNIITKRSSGAGWQINFDNGSGGYYFQGHDATPTQLFLLNGASIHVGSWHVGIATIDRATGRARLGTRSLAGVSSVLADTAVAATTMGNAVAFRLGDNALGGGSAATECNLAAVYVVTGSGAAAGLSANLSTALANFANAVAASWTVSLDTSSGTGRATISNSFWPASLAFTNTTLRDVLGYEYNCDYPQTPAQLTRALGYGEWTNGSVYLCNESSGSLAPAYGATSLTAVSTPTYSHQGARGGGDKAVGFDSAFDSFSAGDTREVSAVDDLVIVWIAFHASTPPSSYLFSKGDGAPTGYFVQTGATGVYFDTYGGGGPDGQTAVVSNHVGEWHVGIVVAERASGKIRIGTQGLRSGTSSVSAEVVLTAHAISDNAVEFRVGSQPATGVGPPTSMTLSYFAVNTGPGVATGLSANLATALSNFATYMKSQTSTKQARGLWLPDCTLDLEGDPKRAPLVSDARQSMSPTGQMITLVGNTFRRHRSIVWSHVPTAQAWDAEATYGNGSWEEFFTETQLGLGSPWLTPGSLIQIYDHSGVRVGVDANVAGWSIVGVNSIEPPKSVPGYTGLWRIELPRLIAVGS